ncbi:MAG TPA: hypothetical protein VHS96_04775 [Bacteroidia bacterium]|nr:hypothetical protein [Bacteroidia bacterium]
MINECKWTDRAFRPKGQEPANQKVADIRRTLLNDQLNIGHGLKFKCRILDGMAFAKPAWLMPWDAHIDLDRLARDC